ncbi:MAG: HD domain-containing protein [Patescibacteria group bacterium]|nr:HD domain-containing protein [Patescibacteria group bacterium]
MENIIDIYKKYRIMNNLQQHQLRVAAVAQLICDSISVSVDKESIIVGCLLHDMGNIIKFNLNYFPEFNKPEGLEYWQKVKDEYIEKYGQHEHHATIEITRELDCNDYIRQLINVIDADYIAGNSKKMNLDEKIMVYVDNRVSPHGIVSLYERSDEAQTRYRNHPNKIEKEKYNNFISNLELFEKDIFSHSNIKPEDITNQSVFSIIEDLKNFHI